MKIAIFYNLNFGGAKRVVYEHAKGLQSKGYKIDLYTINSQKDAFDPTPFCENVYTYTYTYPKKAKFIQRIINNFYDFYVLRKLNKQMAADMDTRGYEFVLIHPDKYTQAPFVLRYLKTKSYYYCQEPLRMVYEYSMRLRVKVNVLKRMYEEINRYYRKVIDRENVRKASYCIASCFHVRERMIEVYEVFPFVVYCGVDANTFNTKKVKKKNEIFFVGSPAVIEDGYDLVRDAMNYIPEKVRPRLHIVSWKKENGERLSEKELVNIYNQSIATICPSRLETFGLVPLESMSCGVPVIATNVSGHRETVLNNRTGYLVEFDPKDIAQKILYLINNKKKNSQMGNQGRKWVEDKWTWPIQIGALDTLFKKNI